MDTCLRAENRELKHSKHMRYEGSDVTQGSLCLYNPNCTELGCEKT